MITAVLQSRRKCYCCSTCDFESERRDILGKQVCCSKKKPR